MIARIEPGPPSRLNRRPIAPRAAAILVAMLALIALQALAWADEAAGNHALQQLSQSLNLAWVLVCGFLVMFMQVGFAMFETGFTRAKNAVNTMAMNLVIYPVGLFGFWIVGYALMMGGVSNWPSLGVSTMAHRELSIGDWRPSVRPHRLREIRAGEHQP
jgi:Ammonium Transporter Family